MGVLGVQHMFAMFGATVLVPALTGLSVSATLLFAGLGTLLFHFLTKGKVPAFLGSSFAFIGGYAAITTIGADEAGNSISDYSLLPYACFGVACAGLLYLVLAALIKAFGANKVMKFFPPIVTGPIIIAIGLTLSSSAIQNCQANWLVAVVAIAIIIICNIWGKGMIKIIPIMLGVIGSSLVAVILHFTGVMETLDPAKLELNMGLIAEWRAAEVVETPEEADYVFADDYVSKVENLSVAEDGSTREQIVIRSFDVEKLAALANA
jgi:uracil permease